MTPPIPDPGGAAGSRQGTVVRPLDKAKPNQQKHLKEPFLNPYSFLPFTADALPRSPVRPRDTDDAVAGGFTGTVTVTLRTVTPLLSSDPVPTRIKVGDEPDSVHEVFSACRIGDDAVLPASGVRGALRSMCEALCGASVGVLADHIWLREGRYPNGRINETAILAEVLEPGGIDKPGVVILGDTAPFVASDMREPGWDEKLRRAQCDPKWKTRIYLDENMTTSKEANGPSTDFPWRLKIVGPRIDGSGMQLDAVFRRDGPFKKLKLSAAYWTEFIRLNHGGALDKRAKVAGAHLKQGDLIWLVLKHDAPVESIRLIEERHVLAISWTRWARRGSPMWNRMPGHAHPGAWSTDGKVDLVAGLFGTVPLEEGQKAGELQAFAGRVRPDNLVFSRPTFATGVPLAPLMPPHPSNRAFYRHGGDPETVCAHEKYFDPETNEGKPSRYPVCPLRGYKTYRAPEEGGRPWLWPEQPVYDDNGQPFAPQSKFNRTVDLLEPGTQGTCTIALRSCSAEECGLLLTVLEPGFPWRLGGGKPLGLGCCTVLSREFHDETGRPVDPETMSGWTKALQENAEVWASLQARLKLWRESQKPAKFRLRYPRARDSKNKQHGGHVWFGKLAKERMERPWGLHKFRSSSGQLLPHLGGASDDPALYGYDLRL